MTTRFTRVIPTLRIFDIAKAREFYIEFLGFKVDFEHRFEPDLPLFMQVSLGDVVLYLSEHHGDCCARRQDCYRNARAWLPTMPNCWQRNTAMRAPDLSKQPWGATTMTIADPFFNRIEFSERQTET